MKNDYQFNASEEGMSGPKRLTNDQFEKLASYLSNKYGLRIPVAKKMMLESRLQGRLRKHQIPSFMEYIDYAFNPNNDEYSYFIDLVTTHKTYFFREDHQFHFLRNIIPEYLQDHPSRRLLNIWSAGCSSGEEVYSLGMVLNESREEKYKFDFRITGTDISVPVLQQASRAVFNAKELQFVPEDLKTKYFETIHKNGSHYVRFENPEVSKRIKLGVLNLNRDRYNLAGEFDFLFCRNVIIYFDIDTQKKVLKNLIDKLKPGGYLFLGHSETAIGNNLPIKSIRPTIYQKIAQ